VSEELARNPLPLEPASAARGGLAAAGRELRALHPLEAPHTAAEADGACHRECGALVRPHQARLSARVDL